MTVSLCPSPAFRDFRVESSYVFEIGLVRLILHNHMFWNSFAEVQFVMPEVLPEWTASQHTDTRVQTCEGINSKFTEVLLAKWIQLQANSLDTCPEPDEANWCSKCYGIQDCFGKQYGAQL